MEKCKLCKDFYSNEEMNGFCSNCFIKHCEINNIEIPDKYYHLKYKASDQEMNINFETIIKGKTISEKYRLSSQVKLLEKKLNADLIKLIVDKFAEIYDNGNGVDKNTMNFLKNVISKPKLNISTLFNIIVDELKIVSFHDDNNLTINKIFTAEQTGELLEIRRRITEQHEIYKWEHLFSMLTGDYWNNVRATHGVGECYYNMSRGKPSFISLYEINNKYLGENLDLGDGRKIYINGNKDIYNYNIELLKMKMKVNILQYTNNFQSLRLM